MSTELQIIILAAGKGTRMHSALPKVLQPIASKPMLGHVLELAQALQSTQTIVVVGHDADIVTRYAQSVDDNIIFIEQSEQLGTGHAVLMTKAHLRPDAKTLVLYGDAPLLLPETLQVLLDHVNDEQLALLTTDLDNPTGYGRVITQGEHILGVVEEKDASMEEKVITLINTGVIAGMGQRFIDWLPLIKNDNQQQEYYLPDIIGIANNYQTKVISVETENAEETLGANDKQQLSHLEAIYRQRQASALMQRGATVIDPSRIDIRGKLDIGRDVTLDINTVFEGHVRLGNHVTVGANCILRNCRIDDNTVIEPFSMIDDSEVAADCIIGPYARLRPASRLERGSKVGNFVEMKKSTLGAYSKANHFTYLGDATIGEHVNIGAGTITCNYDGANKHQTIIGDHAFIGSNSSLVAPITIGEYATVGAGSTLGGDVQANGLTLSRGPKKHIPNWQRPVKQPKS